MADLDGETTVWQTGTMELEGEPVTLSSWYRAPLQTIQGLYNFDIFAVPEDVFSEQEPGATADELGAGFRISFS
jgi:hypothetical protein